MWQAFRLFVKYLHENFNVYSMWLHCPLAVLCNYIVLAVPSSEEYVNVISPSDPLVFNLQLLHDGHLSGGSGQHDPDEDPSQGLR